MAPKGSSVAWDHFTDLGQKVGECKICKIQLSFKSSVSNLTKHLKRKHPYINLAKRIKVSDFNADLAKAEHSNQDLILSDQDTESSHYDHSYSEVVYLEDEDPIIPRKKESNVSKPASDVKPFFVEYRSTPKDRKNTQETKTEDGIDLFGKYVTNLLRDFPKDACIKVQGDIISLIIQEKLKITANTTSCDSAQNGGKLQFGPVILTAGNENVMSDQTDTDV